MERQFACWLLTGSYLGADQIKIYHHNTRYHTVIFYITTTTQVWFSLYVNHPRQWVWDIIVCRVGWCSNTFILTVKHGDKTVAGIMTRISVNGTAPGSHHICWAFCYCYHSRVNRNGVIVLTNSRPVSQSPEDGLTNTRSEWGCQSSRHDAGRETTQTRRRWWCHVSRISPSARPWKCVILTIILVTSLTRTGI